MPFLLSICLWSVHFSKYSERMDGKFSLHPYKSKYTTNYLLVMRPHKSNFSHGLTMIFTQIINFSLPLSGSRKNSLFPDPQSEYRISPLDPISASFALTFRMILFDGMSSGSNAVYATWTEVKKGNKNHQYLWGQLPYLALYRISLKIHLYNLAFVIFFLHYRNILQYIMKHHISATLPLPCLFI